MTRAKTRSARMGELPVRWELADMRRFRLEERFGLAIIPARSFLHLLDTEDHVQALNNIHQHLQPGGRLIMNFFVPHLQMIAEHSGHLSQSVKFMREFTIPDSGEHYLVWESRQYDVHRQRISERLRYEQVDEKGKVLTTRYRDLTLCYIWPREMEHLLVRCGFEIEALYGSFDREPFDAKSSEQIWVARRP